MTDKDHIVRAQAAVWSVRTRGSSEASVPSLDRWLAKDDSHAAAYAEAQWLWEELGQVTREPASMARPIALPVAANTNFPVRRFAALAACLAVFAVLGAGWFTRAPYYDAARGEQKVVVLADGTRIILNTDTRLQLHFRDDRRDVELVKGEALFDVAHDADRPFVVDAGSEQIRAIGTSFVVRSDSGKVEVTLLSGKVEVTSEHDGARRYVLSPGERLRTSEAGDGRLDQPKIAVVTAWRNGELVLEDTPIVDAVREMNRYTVKPIAIESGRLRDARLSGVFRVTETREFATTVAAIYNLRMTETANELVID